MELKAAAIVHDGRSASIFLQSLLDGHPSVLMLPYSFLGYYYFNYWPDMRRALGPKAGDAAAVARHFRETFVEVFDGSKGSGPLFGLQAIRVDAEKFQGFVEKKLAGRPVTRKSFFIALHLAYAKARFQDVSGKTLIVFPMHDPLERTVDNFSEDFPDAKIVMMTRDPRASYSSLLRYTIDLERKIHGEGYDEARSLVWFARFLYRRSGGETLARGFPREQVRAIRLEDLHTKSESVMRALAGWLEIPYDESLLKGTFNGEPYAFAQATSVAKPVTGFNPEVVKSDSWKSFYAPGDLLLLEILFARRLRAYGYEPQAYRSRRQALLAPLLALAPAKYERESAPRASVFGLMRALWTRRSLQLLRLALLPFSRPVVYELLS
jgi:hypothetical protein